MDNFTTYIGDKDLYDSICAWLEDHVILNGKSLEVQVEGAWEILNELYATCYEDEDSSSDEPDDIEGVPV